MKFSGIVSQLRNDELRAGSDLLFQFVILDHLFRFGCLEGRNDSSGKKIAGLVTNVTFDSRIRQALGSCPISVAGYESDPDQRPGQVFPDNRTQGNRRS